MPTIYVSTAFGSWSIPMTISPLEELFTMITDTESRNNGKLGGRPRKTAV